MKNYLLLTITILLFQGCATWDGVKKDSSSAWEVTKNKSSEAWDSTKEGSKELYEKGKDSIESN